MNVLFIFMDGVGLGVDDPQVNPFSKARLPNLTSLLDGSKLVADHHRERSDPGKMILHTQHTSLLALDACLGVAGAPQSASGQAALLTGKNVPQMLGFHDGPKPNPKIMEILQEGTLFSAVLGCERKAALLNAYPPRYFDSIDNGHRLTGVIALSARYAGLRLKTKDDLYRGEAISADFTAQGWRNHLAYPDAPLLDPIQAGERMMELSAGYGLALFEYWLSDVAGHQQDMQQACELLSAFDAVVGGLVGHGIDNETMVLVTSDHGNLEDLSTRHHTLNEVPLLLIGSLELREKFISELLKNNRSSQKLDLTDITPAILRLV